jgi:hypothetical protein
MFSRPAMTAPLLCNAKSRESMTSLRGCQDFAAGSIKLAQPRSRLAVLWTADPRYWGAARSGSVQSRYSWSGILLWLIQQVHANPRHRVGDGLLLSGATVRLRLLAQAAGQGRDRKPDDGCALAPSRQPARFQTKGRRSTDTFFTNSPTLKSARALIPGQYPWNRPTSEVVWHTGTPSRSVVPGASRGGS